jgi:hypothetical protein
MQSDGVVLRKTLSRTDGLEVTLQVQNVSVVLLHLELL